MREYLVEDPRRWRWRSGSSAFTGGSMATWGEFLKEFKIVNQKGQVLVQADEVLDVWEERNKLRAEIEELRQQAAQAREAFQCGQVSAARNRPAASPIRRCPAEACSVNQPRMNVQCW